MSVRDRYQIEELEGYSSKSMLKISEMNKLFTVDGVTPGGWIARMDRIGRPIKAYAAHDGVKRYRVGELIAKARACGCEFAPPKPVNSKARYIDQQMGSSRHKPHLLEVAELSRALTSRSLRPAKEIVAKAQSVKNEYLCGVYFLVKGGSVVYVGQSTNVYNRVNAHLANPHKTFDSWCYIKCERRMLDVLESLYIHFLQPSQQGRLGGSDQLSSPLSIDELFSRLSVRRAA